MKSVINEQKSLEKTKTDPLYPIVYRGFIFGFSKNIISRTFSG